MKPTHAATSVHRGAGLAAIAAASLFASPTPTLFAQTLDDVVISASRSEQRSFDAPGSIQSVGRDVIESAGPQINISEALSGVPGINVANRNNFSQDLQISIRGFGSRAPFGVRGVRLIIDGIPQTLPDGQGQSSQFALTSADRIEVLKGPIAMLYGNASGGVVNVITKSPGEKPELSILGYMGSDDFYRSSVQYSEKKGDYGLVIDYAKLDSKGFREYSAAKRDHLNAKFEIYGSQSNTTLIANFLDNKRSEDPGSQTWQNFQQDPFRAFSTNLSSRNGKAFTQGMFGITHRQKTEHGGAWIGTGYYGTRDLENPINDNYNLVDRVFWGGSLAYEIPGYIGPFNAKHTLIFDYDNVKDSRSARTNSAGVPVGDLNRSEDNLASSSGLALQSSVFFTESLSAIVGARLSKVRLQVKDYFPISGANPDSSGSRNYSGFSPVFGITRHLGAGTNLYAQVGRGFETATLNEVLYSGAGGASNNRFNGSIAGAKSLQLELGFKHRNNETGYEAFGAAFLIKTNDEIVANSVSAAGSTWQNADTRRLGIELGALQVMEKNVRLLTSISWISAEYVSAGSIEPSKIAPGKEMPGIPAHRAVFDVTWRSSGWHRAAAADGRQQIGIELINAGSQQVNSLNTGIKAPGYTIANLKASLDIKAGPGAASLYARIENLADKRYVGSVIADQSSNRFYEPGMPRSWLLGMKYRWDI